MKIAIVLGTRPEIIKLSPVIRACQKEKLDFFIVHTTQHYTECMDKVFFDELDLPRPKYNLGVRSGTHGVQTGKMLIKLERVLVSQRPEIVLVQGDTNTVLAGGLSASKLGIKVGHVEAGLRSYDRTMPEEINRLLVDHISDYLFAPTKKAVKILQGEGIPQEKIFLTGNTIVDAVFQNLKIAKQKKDPFRKLKISSKRYFLLTLHRPSNVDNKEIFSNILKGLGLIFKNFNLPIIFPIHPRTEKQLGLFGLKLPKGIIKIEPVGYLDFLLLEESALACLTDSGGIQEEACILKVPCITIRNNTERPESIEVGANVLVGTEAKRILAGTKKMIAKKPSWKNPFGDGKSGERIVRILKRKEWQNN